MRDLNGFIIFLFSCLIILITGADVKPCYRAPEICEKQNRQNFPRCMEQYMRNCSTKLPRAVRLPIQGYFSERIQSLEATLNTKDYTIHIPSEALQRSRKEEEANDTEVDLIVSVLNKTFFMTNSGSEVVHGENVLGVWLGVTEIHNLSEPVKLRFRNTQTEKGTCVYWHLDKNGEGTWSTEGCSTTVKKDEYVCSCNHLSFFAVLINPTIPDEVHIVHLNYISYVGSALSIAFTAIVMIMFLCQRKKQSEHSIKIHAQLTGSLFLLHVAFLCSVWFSGRSDEVCLSLGLFLHWCLLATFSWMAIEGFHLYMLLVRVFNIYIKRYLLKLSLVGWGIPTVTVMICGVIGKYVSVYGKYPIHKESENSVNASICWITTQTVSYITVNGYLGLVMIFNTVMLGVVLVKMHQLRSQDLRTKSIKRRVWKDWASLLGLCFVLGVPWSLAFFTRAPLNLPALYMFSILNSFQGVFIFLWFLTLACQARKEEYVSSKGTMQVSFQSHDEHVTSSLTTKPITGKN